jgi:hypothetical protein
MKAARSVDNGKMSTAKALSVEMMPPIMIVITNAPDDEIASVKWPVTFVIGSEISIVRTFVWTAYVVITCASDEQQR